MNTVSPMRIWLAVQLVLSGILSDEARLNALAEESGGPQVALSVRCDVQDWSAQQRLVERTRDAWGRLDIVFANAGWPPVPDLCAEMRHLRSGARWC